MTEASNTRFLNREGQWLDFQLRGLELRGEGTLRLESLPLLPGAAPPWLKDLEAPSGPAGVAELPSGDVAFTDPDAHRLLMVEACGASRRAACLGGPGSGPDELHTPRGLVHHASAEPLLVADSGNHRIQVLSLPGLDLQESWDGAGVLEAPQSLAVDDAGSVYVADGASGRVDKLDPVLGEPDPAFWDAVRAGGEPAAVEVTVAGDRVLALDRDGHVHVFDTDGRRDGGWDTGHGRPIGLAFSGGQVLIGDNDRRRLFAFRPDGPPVGEAHGYDGPVAAIAATPGGGVLVHAGDACAPAAAVIRWRVPPPRRALGRPVSQPVATQRPPPPAAGGPRAARRRGARAASCDPRCGPRRRQPGGPIRSTRSPTRAGSACRSLRTRPRHCSRGQSATRSGSA